jgi:hypothetical protein
VHRRIAQHAPALLSPGLSPETGEENTVPDAPARTRPKAEQAIAALLKGLTYKAAAAEAGMNERTLRAWLAQEWFRTQYDAAKKQLLDSTINMLRSAGQVGVNTLRDVANNKKAPFGARATAARSLLEMLLRACELQDVTGEMEQLREALAQRKGGDGGLPSDS